MTSRTAAYPKTEQAIRMYSAPHNAPLRRMIRQTLEAGQDVRTLARTVALTGVGTAKLQAVYDAWRDEQETADCRMDEPSPFDEEDN